MKQIRTQTILTCPKCGKEQSVKMPIDACQYFYKCISCGEILKPKEGDCCVFCSYADTRCPSKQAEAANGIYLKRGGEKLWQEKF